MSDKPHICFVAPAAWPVLSGDRSIKSVGGAEVQVSFLARAFAKLGYRVSMICMDYGQPEGVEIDGVRVIKAHTPQGGLPVLRFVHPRFTSIWQAMKRADADIYYQRACGVHTGFAAAFCKRYGRKFVYAAASDADFNPTEPLIRYRDKAIYHWGLKRAHLIVAQNPTQVKLFRDSYGIEATQVQSCYVPSLGAAVKQDGYVLWVSTLRQLKRPELFFELARRLPQYRFRMVGGSERAAYFADLRRQAEEVKNLEFVGFVPYADIEQEFDGARLFVNTSEHEGFPNTFLQAWARGIPTVSFVDTGSTVEGQPVVHQVGNVAEMAETVRCLMVDDKTWREAGARCAARYVSHHSIQAVIACYALKIESLMVNIRGNEQ